MRSHSILALFLAALSLILTACEPESTMAARGFRLPDGDPAAGRAAFLYMQCHQCHTIKGEQLPVITDQDPPYVELAVRTDLGHRAAQLDVRWILVSTYGQLVTSIINPTHKLAVGYAKEVVTEDGMSKMYNYNQFMTVQELTDIVMFLQPYYKVVVPEFRYPVYP